MTSLTIGRLAEAAAVNVETVRYYQRIGLLEVPEASSAYRHYDDTHLQQLLFIRRAKEAGFTLAEIGELLHMDAVRDRSKIRQMASLRLTDIEARIQDMQALAGRLQALIEQCEHAGGQQCCPIVETFRT